MNPQPQPLNVSRGADGRDSLFKISLNEWEHIEAWANGAHEAFYLSLKVTLSEGSFEIPLEEGLLTRSGRAFLENQLQSAGVSGDKIAKVLSTIDTDFFQKIQLYVVREGEIAGKWNLDPEKAAEAVLKAFSIKTLVDTDETLYFEDGKFRPGAEAKIRAWLEAHVEEVNERLRSEVLNHVKARTYTERGLFDQDPFVLNLQNGLLDLRTWKQSPHTPEYLSLVQLPVKYDPGRDCPRIRKFLSEVLNPEDIPVLQEYVGYCLWRDYPAAKALFLLGEGNNGKSTLINLVKRLLGPGNFSARGLQELELNRFAKADLYGKLANLFADLPDSALNATGTFKMLTGRDPMTAEKKFQSSFTFTNYAKLIFSANKVPDVKDDTTGFFRRWIIVNFPNEFEGDKDNKGLLEELTTEEELTGFLNFALEGLKRLREHGWNFTNAKSTEQVRVDYLRKASPIRAFLMDCTEIKADGFVSKKEMYEAFIRYCKVRKLPLVTEHTFYANLPQFAAVSELRPTVGNRQVRGLSGLSLKPDSEWTEKEIDEYNESARESTAASSYSSHICEVCKKEGGRGLVREGRVVYLHPQCEDRWEGRL